MRRVLIILFVLILINPVFGKSVCEKYNMKHGLFSINENNQKIELIMDLPYETNYDKLKISPLGNKIVYLRCIKDKNSDCFCDSKEYLYKEVVLLDLETKTEKVISKNKGGFNDYPSWSPDGKKFIFIHSNKINKANTDFWEYDLEKDSLKKITNTPKLMESDNFWNNDNTISFLAKGIKNQKLAKVNNLYELNLENNKVKKLTNYKDKDGLIRHCCLADPKKSPDNNYITYVEFDGLNGSEGIWNIKTKHIKSNKIEKISNDKKMNLWPMWNYNSSKLLWATWNQEKHEYSINTKSMINSEEKEYKLISEGISLKMGEKNILFAKVNWPNWHPKNKAEIYFVGTYASW